jgi:8-oxo-dGTP diphosphatase
MSLNKRPLKEDYWISTSCHNIRELKWAEQLGVDFCLIAPVKNTASHSDVSPLGWDHLKTLIASTGLPVYALGGLQAEDLKDALSCGAQGLAMISAVWNSEKACDEIGKILRYPTTD